MAKARRINLPDWSSLLDPPARYKALFGGRASAKSKTVAMKLVLKLANAPAPGLRCLCAREFQTSLAESSKRDIEDAIEACGLSSVFRITDKDIECANGSRFLFAGLQDAERIKSMTNLAICWVEEAQAVSKRSLDLLIPTIREERSELWFTWNPRFPDDPVDVLFRGLAGPPEGSVVKQLTYADNPFLSETIKAEIERCRRRSPEDYRHIWLGGYLERSDAQVLQRLRLLDFETPEDARLRFGADWGFGPDPTVLIRSFIGRLEDGQAIADEEHGDTIFVDHDATAFGCPIEALPALFDQVPDSRRWPIVADSAGTAFIEYLSSKSFQIRAAKKGPGSVEAGVEFLRSFDIVVHPRCTAAHDELALYSWKIDRRLDAVLPQLAEGNDHRADALRYSYEGMRPHSGNLECVTAGRRVTADMEFPSFGAMKRWPSL